MSPQVTIAPETLSRLQKHAVPLVDDINSVLNKLMDIAEGKQGAPAPTATAKDFSDGRVPNLTHTKILSAQIGGKALGQSDTNWNRFLDRVILEAATKLNDVKALKQLIIINHVVGKKENQGYRHLPKAGISVQGKIRRRRGKRRRTSSRPCT